MERCMNRFSIIIPTLNEADNIPPLLCNIADVMQVFNLQPEIIFVDDGSSDGTCSKILEYNGSLSVRLLQRTGKKGLTGAVLHGADHARYDNLVVMDADLSHQPESIPELIAPLFSDKSDMVIGSRYTAGGNISGWPFRRRVSSKLATLPAHFLTGIEDPLSGFFSIKKRLLSKIHSNETGFKIGFEILRLHGDQIKVAEVPIHFTDRCQGSSKMGLGVLSNYFCQLISCFGMKLPQTNLDFFILAGVFAALFDGEVFKLLSNAGIAATSSHIISFIMSTHLLYLFGILYFLDPDAPEQSSQFLSAYRHLLYLFLPALFIRGALLSLVTGSGASLQSTAIALGLLTTLTWFVFASTLKTASNSIKISKESVVLSIILYTLALRFIYLGTTELIQEEAYYWNYAQHLAPGYLDHPPLVALVIWCTTKIAGNSEIGIRLGSYFCWFVTAYYSYNLTRRMYSAKAAIYSVLLIAVLPIFFGAALVMTPDALLLSCWAAVLYYLYRALIENHSPAWIGAGVAFGLGLLSKYTIALLGPSALLFMLLDPVSRRWLRRSMPYMACFIAVVIFSPVIWWNAENSWASFLFQSYNRVTDIPMFTTHKLLGSIVLLLTPIGMITAVLALLPWNISFLQDKINDNRRTRPYLFTLVMTTIPFLVFFYFSLTKEVKLNWTGPIWLATIPFMANAFLVTIKSAGSTAVKTNFFSVGWPKTVISLIFIYGIALHYLSIGLPGVPYPKNTILLGWDDLSRKIEATASLHRSSSGKRPIVVGMDKYRIASGLSFYSTKVSKDRVTEDLLPITGRHLFDLDSLMFSYWHPNILFSHQDLLVISQSRIGLHPDYFNNKAMTVSDIKEIPVEKKGRIVSKYYYRILTGYIPSTSEQLAVSN